MTDKSGREKAALTDRLNELETLLGEGGDAPGPEAARQPVPILDELVDPEEYGEADGAGAAPPETGERLEDIAERLERKLSAELDEIVGILKGSLKESILSELNERANRDPDQS